MKFHAIVHMVKDMLLCGVPKEFDTGSNESHHKPTKKAAKMTQRKESTFNYQTAIRMTEFLLIELSRWEVDERVGVWNYFDKVEEVLSAFAIANDVELDDIANEFADISMEKDDTEEEMDEESLGEASETKDEASKTDDEELVVTTGGARIRVHYNDDNEPSFEMLGRSLWAKKTRWPTSIIMFLVGLQDLVIDHIPQKELPVLTLHERGDLKFYGIPNYQGTGPWKDWALVDWGQEGVLPVHIWCFVDLDDMPGGRDRIEYGGVHLKDGVHAVVECASYSTNYEEICMSDLFTPVLLEADGVDENGIVKRKFYLADVEAIKGPCAIIPDISDSKDPEKLSFFQVKSRPDWSKTFIAWLDAPHHHDEMDMADYDEKAREEKEKEEAKAAAKAAKAEAKAREKKEKEEAKAAAKADKAKAKAAGRKK